MPPWSNFWNRPPGNENVIRALWNDFNGREVCCGKMEIGALNAKWLGLRLTHDQSFCTSASLGTKYQISVSGEAVMTVLEFAILQDQPLKRFRQRIREQSCLRKSMLGWDTKTRRHCMRQCGDLTCQTGGDFRMSTVQRVYHHDNLKEYGVYIYARPAECWSQSGSRRCGLPNLAKPPQPGVMEAAVCKP